MRLICPRCGAQYEVDDSVIPASGRDVQCSGCGQTWFQPSAEMIAAAAAEAEAAPEAAIAAPVPPAEEYEEDYDLPAPPTALDWDDTPKEDAPQHQSAPQEPEPARETDPTPEPEPEPEQRAAPEPEPEPELTPEPPAETDASIAALMQQESPAPTEEPALEALSSPYDAEELPAAPSPSEPSAAAPRPAVPRRHEPPRAEPDLGPAPRVGVVPRRAIDENLLAILREEAEREAAARQAEGQRLETQDEMNLEPARPARAPVTPPAAPAPVAPPAPVAAPAPVPNSAPGPGVAEVAKAPTPARTALRVPAQEPLRPPRPVPDFSDLNDAEEDDDPGAPETEEPAAASRAARRQRLPDIEEINSTLRASGDRGRDPAALGARQARTTGGAGFRFGFALVVVIAAGLLALYVFAPRLAETVPSLQPALARYVSLADSARIWLDDSLKQVIATLGQAPSN
ncbi:zinc-ribbon domain-containing protein [Rhodobacter lacus]|uniref:Zinc-ribbon domain-containing protein n=1 Tax=Rhodobacter lacus TaxID=1641972 RepID=A0ABW5A8F6_9RHOB